MSNIVPFTQLGTALPAIVAEHIKAAGYQDNLSAGISGGFAVWSYKGKVWRVRHRGEETMMLRPDDGSPRAAIDVVIVEAAPNLSKVYYAGGYVEGDTSPPDCFSVNGVTPDASATAKQSNACATCPQAVRGSKVTDTGKPAKACQDSKRLAVVPLDDIENAQYDGPMLLRVPAASLTELRAYAGGLNRAGYPSYVVGTRISFDPQEAYPKLLFAPVRVLTDDEAAKVLELIKDERVQRILSSADEVGGLAPETDPMVAQLGPVPAAVQQAMQATQGAGQPGVANPAAPARRGRPPVNKAVQQAQAVPQATQQAAPTEAVEDAQVEDADDPVALAEAALAKAKAAAEAAKARKAMQQSAQQATVKPEQAQVSANTVQVNAQVSAQVSDVVAGSEDFDKMLDEML